MHKINKVRSMEYSNFLNTHFYSQYKETSDYKKIAKISEEYFTRYSSELEEDCVEVVYDVPSIIESTKDFIKMLFSKLN